MIYIGDLATATYYPKALTVGNVTQTTTGPAVSMASCDGNCVFLFGIGSASITAVTAQVQQSTLSNSGFTNVTGGSCYLTAAGQTGVAFNRDFEFLQTVITISGTTATGIQGNYLEAYKVF